MQVFFKLWRKKPKIKVMKKDLYQLRRRNKAIHERYEELIRNGMPFMLAYEQTGEDFYLSEETIRKIINRK